MHVGRRELRRLVIVTAPVVVWLAIATDFPWARNRGVLTTVAAWVGAIALTAGAIRVLYEVLRERRTR